VTGEIYGAAAGRVSRFFMGMTPGYINRSLSPDDVRAHFDEIRSTDTFVELHSSAEEMAHLRDALAAARTG
jgi:hypothetical protein